MRSAKAAHAPIDEPQLQSDAAQLMDIVREASPDALSSLMKISAKKANEVHRTYANWSTDATLQMPAIDSFIGDIYSGLQVQTWSDNDRAYAHRHLLILSGLYGALRACDGVMPYRLEMGYKLPDGTSLYQFWGARIARLLPDLTSHVINLSAIEYTKAVLPFIVTPVITPKFLTISPKTGKPTFVTVHAKIARGAFARWLIQQRIEDIAQLTKFTDLGYRFNPDLSTPDQPVFVCQTFQGIGLSVRLG